METALLVVEDCFEIRGRGLVLLPGVDIRHQRVEEREVLVRAPEGEIRRWTATIQIPTISPSPEELFALVLLKAAKKGDVPVGSEVWLKDGQA